VYCPNVAVPTVFRSPRATFPSAARRHDRQSLSWVSSRNGNPRRGHMVANWLPDHFANDMIMRPRRHAPLGAASFAARRSVRLRRGAYHHTTPSLLPPPRTSEYAPAQTARAKSRTSGAKSRSNGRDEGKSRGVHCALVDDLVVDHCALVDDLVERAEADAPSRAPSSLRCQTRLRAGLIPPRRRRCGEDHHPEVWAFAGVVVAPSPDDEKPMRHKTTAECSRSSRMSMMLNERSTDALSLSRRRCPIRTDRRSCSLVRHGPPSRVVSLAKEHGAVTRTERMLREERGDSCCYAARATTLRMRGNGRARCATGSGMFACSLTASATRCHALRRTRREIGMEFSLLTRPASGCPAARTRTRATASSRAVSNLLGPSASEWHDSATSARSHRALYTLTLGNLRSILETRSLSSRWSILRPEIFHICVSNSAQIHLGRG